VWGAIADQETANNRYRLTRREALAADEPRDDPQRLLIGNASQLA
jgi:hypothetical protein